MAFSLKRLVKGVYDDVNMWDGGKSHGNPNPQVAPPPPASTARPQANQTQSPGLSVSPVSRPSLVASQPMARLPTPQVTVAQPQQLTVADTVVAPSPAAKTMGPVDRRREAFLAQQNSMGEQVKQGLTEKLRAPAAVAQEAKELTQDFVTRPLTRVAASVTNTPEIQANNFATRQLIGRDPVLSYQEGFTQRGENPAMNPLTNTPLPKPVAQFGGLLVDAATDLPIIGSMARGAIKAAPEVAPVVADAARQGLAHTTGLVSPKFAGLKKDQVIMDTNKLNTLNRAMDEDLNTVEQQEIINGLHQINADHGLDFITGTPADRRQRINQFLEQNGEAIPEFQQWQAKPGLFRDEVGSVGKDIRQPDDDIRFDLNRYESELPSAKTERQRQFLQDKITQAEAKLSRPIRNDADDPMTPMSDLMAGKKAELEARRANPSEVLPEAPQPTTKLVTPKPKINPTVNPAPLPEETVAKLPASRQTEVQLNEKRLNTTDEGKEFLSSETRQTIEKMSNKDVEKIAKSAGLDMKTNNIQQTRQKIAEQLNVRGDAVRLQREAEDARLAGNTEEAAALLLKSAKQGRVSREQGTDLARQLQARKIIANELDSPQQRIFKLLDNAGVNPEVYTRRLADVDFNDGKKVVEAYRDMVPAKAIDWLDTVRYNSMLSSPLTQMVNIFGNAQNVSLVAPIEKTLRGGVDAVRSAVFGGERKYAAGEGAAYGKAVATNIGKASQNFIDAMRGTGQYSNKDLEYSIPLATKGLKGGTYKTLSFPMRVLDGMDKFFRTLASAGEDAALGAREAKGFPLGGNRDAIKEAEASYRVFQTEIGAPGQGVLDDALDSFAGLVQQARSNDNLILSTAAKFSIPFLKTVNNIAKQGAIDYSPLGFVNLAGNADKTTAVTRAIMGSAIFSASGALIGSGKMTWAEPRDPEERARFRAEGKQAYAVKMGDKWVNFSKLTPAVAFPMAMAAALDDALKDKTIDQGTFDKVLESVSKVGNFLSDQSYVKGVGDTLGAVAGDKEAIAKAVANNIQQVVPFRAFTGWIARISDDVERKVDTTEGYFDQQVESLMSQYPGLRQKTTTRDYKGVPIAANNQVLNGVSPVRVTNDRGTDPLDAAADEAKQAKADEAADDPTLDKSQKAKLSKYLGPKITSAQKELIESEEFKSLDAAGRAKALDKSKREITSAYTRQFKSENDIPIETKASKSDILILERANGNTSSCDAKANDIASFTKTAKGGSGNGVDVNKDINAHSKKVLDQFNTLDAATKKEKAYGEKSYDYKVAQAKYDNDLANNSLSKAQQVKRQDSLAKSKVGSGFTKDTREMFELGKDDLANFLENDQNGKKYAEELIKYDQALTDAGLQAKNKFKNGVISYSSTGKGGGGTGGRKALTSFLTSLESSNSLATQNQNAVLKLVRGASMGTSGAKKATVAKAATKKQSVKKQKAKVK